MGISVLSALLGCSHRFDGGLPNASGGDGLVCLRAHAEPMDLGIVGLVQFVPRVLLTLWAGGVADRFDRRRIAYVCTSIQWIACCLLAIGSSTHSLSRSTIFLLIAMIGAARAFEMPTMQSLLPSIVPAQKLPRALALSTAATQIAIIGGPA